MNQNKKSKKFTKNIFYVAVITLSLFLVVGFFSVNAVSKGKSTGKSGIQISKTSSMPGGTYTSGGTLKGVEVRQTFEIHQDKYPIANNLHFKIWQGEEWIDVNGWEIKISHFTNSNSQRGIDPMGGSSDKHAVDVDVWGADIPYCTWIEIEVTFWLTEYNTLHLYDVEWSKDFGRTPAIPSFGWKIDDPQPDPGNPGQFIHQLTLANDDSTQSFTITGLSHMVTMDLFEDLKQIDFSSIPPVPNFTLNPGDCYTINIITSEPFFEGHIYFTYQMEVEGITAVRNAVADHPITPPISR